MMVYDVQATVLEHLKRFQAGQDCMELDLKEIKTRLSVLIEGQHSILQQIGQLSNSIAHQHISIDHLN